MGPIWTNKKFIYAAVSAPESTHHSRILKNTKLSLKILQE